MNQSDANVERIETASNGEKIPLQPSDIIISALDRVLGVQSNTSSREFCQIVRLYANGTVLARVLGTDAPRLMKVSSIMVNLSFVGAKEQAYTELRRMREAWLPGRPVEVKSRSLDRWCVGYICKCIDLRSDTRIAHGDLWFQLVYFDPDNSKLCYKQVKFDKRDYLRDVDRLKESDQWKQFHRQLLEENEGHIPRQLRQKLGKHVQRRSPSPQSSESTTSMGEDTISDNVLKKASNDGSLEFDPKLGVPVANNGEPLFHRAPSIDELPDENVDKLLTDAVQNRMDDLLAMPNFGGKNGEIIQIRRQPSVDEEPNQVAV